jgi:lipoprotein-anchoring transpeptidase ErfK/SrfK
MNYSSMNYKCKLDSRNPLRPRALHLWQGNKDTLYRIHDTNGPGALGAAFRRAASACSSQDVIDLYERTPPGAKVVVLASRAG